MPGSQLFLPRPQMSVVCFRMPYTSVISNNTLLGSIKHTTTGLPGNCKHSTALRCMITVQPARPPEMKKPLFVNKVFKSQKGLPIKNMEFRREKKIKNIIQLTARPNFTEK